MTPNGVPVTVGMEMVGSWGKGLAFTFIKPINKDARKINPTKNKIFLFTNTPIDVTFLTA